MDFKSHQTDETPINDRNKSSFFFLMRRQDAELNKLFKTETTSVCVYELLGRLASNKLLNETIQQKQNQWQNATMPLNVMAPSEEESVAMQTLELHPIFLNNSIASSDIY
jgi:hypothetical protein